ncbi:patatin-like phospholipase family protein [Rhabdothermincola salaria]|uniref:patatin-like phospholipase family protein n=1 Tax=Rhabdothermincola salaria TaxID=2903142 RepID=UPI001E46F32B|nr:patatin-like phospholipase family protein [Rhabdothermincola salaria]MCD9623817.1 patatin-like phospholipase family protein [Rhabdothermincola salaria]
MGKALVLGGGGVAGVAWETALLLGLRDAGVDLTDADLVVGTSAGSVVAAQITTGNDLAELYEAQLVAPEQTGELAVEFDTDAFTATLVELLSDRPAPQELRRRLGEVALAADTVPEADRRRVIEARLPVHQWPDRKVVVTAVDAATGEFVAFDADGGASLVEAVGASCAVPGVWPPVTIGVRRYIDGGVRSTINADLAAGHDRVVVVAPFAWGIAGPVDDEVAELRASGARVAVVTADEAAQAAFGPNPLDPATRRPAAEAGRAQGAAVAATVAEVWR